VRVLRESNADEMVASFLLGELSSERFSVAIRDQLTANGEPEELLTQPDLSDDRENEARSRVLGATRGYGEDRELFEFFPTHTRWVTALLAPGELKRVRYVEYSYWNELTGGSRLPADAATRIKARVEVFGVSNGRFFAAAEAAARGEQFPPLILAGVRDDDLVCLEGNLRLTGYALAGFPSDVECIVGIHPDLSRWAL
jgi:hypothetical protein